MNYYNNPYTPNVNAYGYVPQPNGYYSGSQTPVPNQQPEPIFKYVSGRSGAEAYPLAPNTNAYLMDNNEGVLYTKATDSYGRYYPLKSYRMVPMEEVSATEVLPQTQESIDYDKIRQMISDEIGKYMDTTNAPKKKEAK